MNRFQRQRGQGMTEYIIIVALIAIAAIATYQYFGNTVRNQTAAIASELAGESGETARGQAKTAADAATKDGTNKRDLSSYVGSKDR